MPWDNLQRWDGVGGRFKREKTYGCLRLVHADVWQKPTQYCKAIILQIEVNKFFLKIKNIKKQRKMRVLFNKIVTLGSIYSNLVPSLKMFLVFFL